jgi:hypothetical protein
LGICNPALADITAARNQENIMIDTTNSIKQAKRLQLYEVPVELIDALLYNGDMNRKQLLELDELAKWDIDRLNLAIELAERAEAVYEREDGLIVLYEATACRRIACYG